MDLEKIKSNDDSLIPWLALERASGHTKTQHKSPLGIKRTTHVYVEHGC